MTLIARFWWFLALIAIFLYLHFLALENTAQRLLESEAKMAALSVIDTMTELYNHRYLTRRVAEEMSRARRYTHPLSLMISDIDNFKNTVDTNGHLAADKILKELGALVKNATRKADTVARWGGDEFVYLLPQTGKEGARKAAEKIQAALQAHQFVTPKNKFFLTLSFGTASFPEDGQKWEEVLQKADRALFAAKKAGKNTVSSWDPGGEQPLF